MFVCIVTEGWGVWGVQYVNSYKSLRKIEVAIGKITRLSCYMWPRYMWPDGRYGYCCSHGPGNLDNQGSNEEMLRLGPKWDTHWLRTKRNQGWLALTSMFQRFRFLLLEHINWLVISIPEYIPKHVYNFCNMTLQVN